MESILKVSQRARQSAVGLSWVMAALLGSGCAGMHHAMETEGKSQGKINHSAQAHNATVQKGQGDGTQHQPHNSGDGQDANKLAPSGHNEHHGHSVHHGHSGHHGSLEIPEGHPIPQIQLKVEPDTIQGWNLQLEIANFDFAPERVNQASVVTEGHAHLFINGEKITRLYGPWYYIPSLPAGENELRVELNANGHESLTLDSQTIEATVKLEVTAP